MIGLYLIPFSSFFRLTHDISLDNFQDENLEQQYELNNIYKSTPDSAESTINFIKDLYTANNRTRGSSRTSLTSQSDTESLKSSQSYTDIVKTPENGKNGYTHGKNDSLSIKDLGVDKISPEMVHMDMMNFEKRKEKKSESRRECKRLDSQEIADSAWSNYANYTKKALEVSVNYYSVAMDSLVLKRTCYSCFKDVQIYVKSKIVYLVSLENLKENILILWYIL